MTLSGYLAYLRRGRPLRHPDEPEPIVELYKRMSRKGFVASIRREVYFDALRRFTVLVRLPLHFLTIDEEKTHLFWLDLQSGKAFARTLPDLEALELAVILGEGKLWTHLALKFGSVPLKALRPRESFTTECGEVGSVAMHQEKKDQVLVFLGCGLGIRTVTLSPETIVNVSLAQVLSMTRRRSSSMKRVRTRFEKVSAMAQQSQTRSGNGTHQRRPEPQREPERNENRPVHELRAGAVKAAIWQQETEFGVRFNVTFSRLYKDGQNWKSSTSFGKDDLPLLRLVAERAWEWILEPKN
jgi:hypothetical protein